MPTLDLAWFEELSADATRAGDEQSVVRRRTPLRDWMPAATEAPSPKRAFEHRWWREVGC